MAWRRQSRTEVDALFGAQRRDDPFGHRLHTWLGAMWCFLLTWPTTASEWAAVPLAACFVVRMLTHHRILGPLVWDRVTRLTLAWAMWLSLSILWSAEPGRWADDLGGLRYAVMVPLLWPVIDRRNLLIAAAVLGVLCGNVSQVVHAVGVWTGGEWLMWSRDPARLSGWWDPVVGGTLLVGALGLWLGGLVCRRTSAVAAAMSVLTLSAIVATGTRGAMLGAAGLLGVALVIAVVRAGPRAARIALPAALAALVVASALAAAVPRVRERVERGRDEVRRVFSEGDFNSDTGARLLMWREAVLAVAGSPINGVGAGGYQAWAVARLRSLESGDGTQSSSGRSWPVHRHAHSMWLHAAATTGLVGGAILLSLVLTGAISGLSSKWGDHPGPALAIIGLALAGVFDSVHVNQQTAAMLWTMLALCGEMRPRAPDDGSEGRASSRSEGPSA